MVKSRFDFTLQKMIDFNNWKISMHCCFQILHTVHNLCTYLSENLFFRGLWLMLEGGLMKFLAKGATEKIVEDADEKRERLSIMNHKVEKILKSSLDLIPSPTPSVKIQIMGGKVCFRCKGKTLLGVVNKLLKTKSLLTSPSNVLPYYLK